MEGSWRGVPLAGTVVICVVLALLFSGCGDGESSSDLGPGAVRTSDPESTFAPLVWLHGDERFRPAGARWFIARSVLWFGEDNGCEPQKISVGRTLRSQRNLLTEYTYLIGLGHGNGYWREGELKDCSDGREKYRYYSNHLTRPYDPSPVRRPDLYPQEGYYLDLVDGARGGEPLIRRGGRRAVGVPAYVERRSAEVDGGKGLRLTYWLLFGAEGDRHEGDWQRVDVMLRVGDDGEYLPEAVHLPEPGRPTRVLPWRSVRRAAGMVGGADHPVLFAARNTHDLRAQRGGGCAGCTGWATWESLVDVKTEPWYGFGGAWGDIGSNGETTGPLGPRGTDWTRANIIARMAANDRLRRVTRRSEVIKTRTPVAAFAPLVRFHAREEHFPISVDRFVERATLKWRNATCINLEDVATGRVADRKTADPTVPRLTPALLGIRPAARREARGPRCVRAGRSHAATDLTRPYDPGERPPGLPRDAGFYLDILSDSKDGDPRFGRRHGQRVLAGTSAYYDSRPVKVPGGSGVAFSYWMLHGYSKSTRVDGDPADAHEGDWERVDVLARRGTKRNRWLPQAVVLYADDVARYVSWRQVGRDGSHPVVYSALSSHVPYADLNSHRRLEKTDGKQVVLLDETGACRDCANWELWRDLRAVRREPWYGFGGGWGFAFQADGTSGPLGPR